MKKKFFNLCTKARNGIHKAKPYILSFAMMGAMILGNVAFAATGKELFTTIVKALGGLSIASGAIIAIMGLIAYGEAQADGEGPAMAKAKKQLTGAIILVIVGVALSAGASSIANMITDISL